jgi:hypothetical protein
MYSEVFSPKDLHLINTSRIKSKHLVVSWVRANECLLPVNICLAYANIIVVLLYHQILIDKIDARLFSNGDDSSFTIRPEGGRCFRQTFTICPNFPRRNLLMNVYIFKIYRYSRKFLIFV